MELQAGARRPHWGPRREKALFLAALALIIIWGFSGSWEFPQEEERPASVTAEPQAASSDLATRGSRLFQDNGCYACHSTTGERKIGPSLLGIVGEPVELSDGSSRLVDDDYLIESILYPQAVLVAGFDDAAMPSYEGVIDAEDARALAAYIKSLD